LHLITNRKMSYACKCIREGDAPDNTGTADDRGRDRIGVLGFSLDEAAKRIGVTKSHLWELEQGSDAGLSPKHSVGVLTARD
jgi:hypothetical protein